MKLSEHMKQHTKKVLLGDLDALWSAFGWVDTPQGFAYWEDQCLGKTPLDRATLIQWLHENGETWEEGTLEELNVQEGDVIELLENLEDENLKGKVYTCRYGPYGLAAYRKFDFHVTKDCKWTFRVISRATPSFVIKEGKYYKTRSGGKVGPAENDPTSTYPWNIPWKAGDYFYTKEGKSCIGFSDDDIVSEWVEEEPQEKTYPTWKEMTPEEKGVLLLAHHEGKGVEFFCNGCWTPLDYPSWYKGYSYRIKPEPKVEEVTLFGVKEGFDSTEYPWDTYKITFNLVDGEPDYDSVQMEKL